MHEGTVGGRGSTRARAGTRMPRTAVAVHASGASSARLWQSEVAVACRGGPAAKQDASAEQAPPAHDSHDVHGHGGGGGVSGREGQHQHEGASTRGLPVALAVANDAAYRDCHGREGPARRWHSVWLMPTDPPPPSCPRYASRWAARPCREDHVRLPSPTFCPPPPPAARDAPPAHDHMHGHWQLIACSRPRPLLAPTARARFLPPASHRLSSTFCPLASRLSLLASPLPATQRLPPAFCPLPPLGYRCRLPPSAPPPASRLPPRASQLLPSRPPPSASRPPPPTFRSRSG